MVSRFGDAKVQDPNACRNYAADITKQLDERLAKEAAGK
jgi:metallo-beta-lactamase class B